MQNQSTGQPALVICYIPESVLKPSDRGKHDIQAIRQKQHLLDAARTRETSELVMNNAPNAKNANAIASGAGLGGEINGPSERTIPTSYAVGEDLRRNQSTPPSSIAVRSEHDSDDDDEVMQVTFPAPTASATNEYQLFTRLWANQHTLPSTSDHHTETENNIDPTPIHTETEPISSAPLLGPIISPSTLFSHVEDDESDEEMTVHYPSLQHLMPPMSPSQTQSSTTTRAQAPSTNCPPSPITPSKGISNRNDSAPQFLASGVPVLRSTRGRAVVPAKSRLPEVLSGASTPMRRQRPRPRPKFAPQARGDPQPSNDETSLADDPYNRARR